MAPLQGVTSIRGDITSVSTAKRVIAASGGEKSQLVICDGAPDVTGLHTLDAYLQAQLLLAAFSITIHLLAPGGWFIAKIFRTTQDPRAELLVSQMRCFFPEKPNDEGGVWIRKPRSSREGSGGAYRRCMPESDSSDHLVIFDSTEAFIVCRNFQPPPGLSVSTAALESASSDSLLDAFKHFAATSGAEGLKDDRSVEKAMGWVGSGDLSYVALYPWSTLSVRADTPLVSTERGTRVPKPKLAPLRSASISESLVGSTLQEELLFPVIAALSLYSVGRPVRRGA